MPQDSLCNTSVTIYKTKAFCIPGLDQEISQEARLVRIFLHWCKTHAKLFLQSATLINRRKGKQLWRLPLPKHVTFCRAGHCELFWCPNWAPLNTCTPWSFFPVERASPGGSHIQIQLLGRRETHFLSSFPPLQSEWTNTLKEKHFYSAILSTSYLVEKIYLSIYKNKILSVETVLSDSNPKN